MRDKLKTNEYFDVRINSLYEGINTFNKWIETGKTPKERVNFVKKSIVWDYISIIVCKYSKGVCHSDLVKDLENAITILSESWDSFEKLKNDKGVEYNQYTITSYNEMLMMLSLSYLLNISNEYFKKLVDVIDKDNIKDYLFEFIIRAKYEGSRYTIYEESYKDFFGIPDAFENLRKAINEKEAREIEKLIFQFLSTDWYNIQKYTSLYNSHKSKNNTYFGYWSFETAAVVKILGLRKDIFKGMKYYPSDFPAVVGVFTIAVRLSRK